ncbi:Pls/PosA family non-ribosomal peptide synthetase [Streptomyces sp. NPDC059477]|uniref:Pls/PosA family non-ribosomal peptide synthetase n=1 Tax=Streptomyces sp. NPDC059477 TaxID=3346847 RepID=UPI00368C0EBF
MHCVFEAACDRSASSPALECGRRVLSYAELDARANQLAHFLRSLGTVPGARVGILLPRSVDLYAALLAVGKAGAVFVPMDPAAPRDRTAYIARDARVDVVVTVSGLSSALDGLTCKVIELDTRDDELAAAPMTRPERYPPQFGPPPADPAAYILYTSGSTGRPKGVEIAQSSICNFLSIIPGVYGVRSSDRVYQGMTITFDFSIEEIWPTWSVGATLVAGPEDSGRLGGELADFLDGHGITVLYCVPTLLETVPRELPRLRTLVVGGEVCPAGLVQRWSRPGRRFLNTYGPTETTVTATWTELLPGRPVTIGRPLPTCSVLLLDARRQPVGDGEVGEICIGGPGVARGYIGRPELTADRFIGHPLAPGGGTLYRTGDLGRLTPDGEIEYLGRADGEVKIRGYRVDLGEIDSVILEDPDVAEALTTLARVPGTVGADRELAAYVVPAPGAAGRTEELVRRLHKRLMGRLPAYMVPSFLDLLDALPTLPSGKADRKALPAPTGNRLTGGGPAIAPAGEGESRMRDAWATVLRTEPAAVSVEADFFTELGGHSLLAAQVVSLLRDRGIGANPTVRDLYAHPTVRALAAHLGEPEQRTQRRAPPRPEPIRHRGRRIAMAGCVQGSAIYLLFLLLTLPLALVFGLHRGHVTDRMLLQTAAASFVGYLAVRWLVPVTLARPLAAGIRPGRYPLWSGTYLRLWAINLLLSVSPLPVLSGSPMMGFYLRLLGARVGPRTTIATNMISMPSFLRIGADTSIGYGVSLRPWRVADGWVTLAPVDIGPGAYIGANAVIEAGARMEAGAGLGEQSGLDEDEVVPAGARWAGSPAQPVDTLTPAAESMLRTPDHSGWRARHMAAALSGLVFLETAAIATAVPSILVVWWAWRTWGTAGGFVSVLLSGPVFVLTVCAVVAAGKRLFLPHVPAGTHPVRSALGVRKWVSDKLLEFSLTFTNSLYATLYTPPWLRLLGARIGRGSEVATASHLDPNLLTIGDSSFVADLATVGSATFAAGQVMFQPTEVGRRSFIGNAAFVPSGTTTGPGSLIGVGTIPPRDGVPAGTSWLGSPAMYLPVRQSSGSYPEELTFRPPRKAKLQRLGIEFLRATMPAALIELSGYPYLLALSAVAGSPALWVPVLVSPLLAIGASLIVIMFCVLVKRCVAGTYRPRVEPLWSLFVRRAEFATGLYEAAAVPAGINLLVGTPFLPAVLRWFGARIGRRTWIGTTFLTEFDLVRIGDDAAIGIGVSLQTHLFEDRVMKMSPVTVHDGASIGTRSVVLYDSVTGKGAWLGALSLLMKGEHLTTGTSWRGMPAEGMPHRSVE